MDTHFLVHNIVKNYPTYKKIVEYKKPFKKQKPNIDPSQLWAFPHQYIEHKIFKIFYEPPQIIQKKDIVQVPFPFSRHYERYIQSQQVKTYNLTRNEKIHQIDSIQRSQRRTRSNIFDIIACNQFDMFVTFTFSHDRFDIQKSKTKMMNWLKSQQKIHKKKNLKPFGYIIIPEFHKDRKAIHFHALLKDYKGDVVLSSNPKTGKPVIQKGKLIYNIKSYKSGHTNMTYIVNQLATARYVTKYVTKDIINLPNQRRYWHSSDLKRPEKLYNEDLSKIDKVEVFSHENYTISHSHAII